MLIIMSFIERITNQFSFYTQEELYFKRIAIRSNYVYSAAISRIIKDIENDWNNLEINWFINYCLINNNLDLVATLGDYDIIISYEQLQYILNNYPDFDLLLASIIRKNNISINEILMLSNNVNITNLLIMYTDIKGILSDERYGNKHYYWLEFLFLFYGRFFRKRLDFRRFLLYK